MDTTNDPLYLQTKALQRGELALPAVHRAFLDLLHNRFGIKALHLRVDAYSKREFGQQFLEIVVPRLSDSERLRDSKDKAAIAAAFINVLRDNPAPTAPGFALEAPEQLTNLSVLFYSVEQVAALEAAEKLQAENPDYIGEITKAHAADGVTHIDTLADNHHVVLCATAAQRDANQSNGVNERIRADFMRRLRLHDPHEWITDDALELEFICNDDLGDNFAYYR